MCPSASTSKLGWAFASTSRLLDRAAAGAAALDRWRPGARSLRSRGRDGWGHPVVLRHPRAAEAELARHAWEGRFGTARAGVTPPAAPPHFLRSLAERRSTSDKSRWLVLAGGETSSRRGGELAWQAMEWRSEVRAPPVAGDSRFWLAACAQLNVVFRTTERGLSDDEPDGLVSGVVDEVGVADF